MLDRGLRRHGPWIAGSSPAMTIKTQSRENVMRLFTIGKVIAAGSPSRRRSLRLQPCSRRRAHPVQDRHLGAGDDDLSGLDGGGRRLLREGRAQGRSRQHGRRHQGPQGAAVGRNPGHACRARTGGARQQAGRRPAARHLDLQHHPVHDVHASRTSRPRRTSRARRSASARSGRRPTSPSASCSRSSA